MNFEEQILKLRGAADTIQAAREEGLGLCRKLIQASAKSIRASHRREFDDAKTKLGEAAALANSARTVLRPFPSLYYAGYLQDAEKEFVEASAVLSLIQESQIPDAAELGVEPFTYLHGLGEAASELRRYCLDSLRRREPSEPERLMNWMEAIYDELIGFDYPDGMTGGLRRTTDALRAVIERTRSDLMTTQMQQDLMSRLEQTQELLGEK